jgi:HEAT repeat protein
VGPLVLFTLGLVVATALLLVLLVARRFWLARHEQRHADAAARMRPLAIAFVVEEEPLPPDLSAYDQTVLAEQLRRYSRSLTGEATARIVSYFGESAAFRQALEELRSRRSWRRADAAFALGDMGVDDAAQPLLRALDDRRSVVRTAAARGLGSLHADAAAVPLIEALATGRVPSGVAGNALLRIGTKITPQLRELAATPDPALQATALTVLGLIGDSRDEQAAIDALQEPWEDVRASAAEALGRVGTTASEAALRAALDDPSDSVRAAAAQSLGAIGARAAVPHLLELARTDEFAPARAAARAAAGIDPATVRAAADEPGAGPHLHEAVDRAAL